MTQDNMTRLLVTVIVTALLCLLQNVINARRAHRGRQAMLPFVAILYAAVAVILLSRWHELGQWAGEQARIFQNGDVFILNALLMGGFILLKCVACPILSSQWRDDRLMELTCARFYEYDELYSQWFLQKRWADFRRILKSICLCGAIVCMALLANTWLKGPGTGDWLFFFPCAALIVLNETWNFINGQTKEEFLRSVLGSEADARRVGNFYRIREIYEKLFTPQLLAAHTGCEFSAKQGATDLLNRMEASADPIERNVAQYYLTCRENVAFDVDCIQATSRLMHRESVVFFNPFYRDNGLYLTLPLVNALLKGKKCLVVTGRASSRRDAVVWLTELLRDYSMLRSMWRVQELDHRPPECEVGILSFQQLYDVDILAANRAFLNEADLVLLLEPSVVVNTGQVGLSIVAEETGRYGNTPVYCICDRCTDGLVDTMSHLLRTEITNVVAMPVPRCMYTGMGWDVDGDFIRQKLFDKEAEFLGNGVELAAVAVKNQIPCVYWYGETKAPLRDIKWIAGQYYSTICRYMNLPTQQKSLYETIRFVPNLWCTKATKEQFILVEDEFCNLFTMMRTFLSRGDTQVFVNVLSENYLLRDYMRCNQQMFLSSPSVIPSLAPDYAKTERNTLIKLVLLMSIRPVSEPEIQNELLLAGCAAQDVFDTLSRLLETYTFADGSILEIKHAGRQTQALTAPSTNCFSISKASFALHFASSLKTAYYVVEDEQQEKAYIDAKMFGHVAQTILPGQFVTYDGKYYEVRAISPVNGVILRRASDLYSRRRYYRQLRTYHFDSRPADRTVYVRKTMGMEIAFAVCDYSVATAGYLDMRANHDLRTAQVVNFEDDPATRGYDRSYKNKKILTLRLPDTDDKIRFTICLLLSELFRSVFPDAWQYLAVVTRQPDDIDGMLNYLVYALHGEIEDDEIYIVEDSDLDLGLLDAINRNLTQLLEILADFLDWHFEKMREPEAKDPIPVQTRIKPEEETRRSLFLRMAQRIQMLFPKKGEKVRIESVEDVVRKADVEAAKKSQEAPAAAQAEDLADGAAETDEGAAEDGHVLPELSQEDLEEDVAFEEAERPGAAATPAPDLPGAGAAMDAAHPEDELEGAEEEIDPDLIHIDGTDIFENEGMPEDDLWLEENFRALGIVPIRKSRYQEACYLKFGFDEIDGRLKIEDVRNYLRVRGFSNNTLTKARKRDVLDKSLLDFDAVNCCDFCGVPLSGVSYERLNDGRIRCNNCSASAITTVDEFQGIFYRVLEMMEMFFGVSIHVPISVKMADARAIAKGAGYVFRPSTQIASRVLGYAQRLHGRYSLIIENGSPRVATIDTMIHELTHIWQYLNWNDRQIRRIFAMNQSSCTKRAIDIVYEGMATWASIQCLYQIGETYYAAQQEALVRKRQDVYGVGYRLFSEQYPIVKDMSLIKYSPFAAFPPLEPTEVQAAARSLCAEKDCRC